MAIDIINALHWPRMAATLWVPSAGSAAERKSQEEDEQVFRFDVRPFRARLEANNHNQADELELTFAYDEAGIDPRYLRSAEVYFYVLDAYAFGGFTPGNDNLRFIGITRDVERHFSESKGKVITLKVQDYTCLFLEMKNFPPSGIPTFSDTITTAWQRICDNTGYVDLDTRTINSSVTNLRDKLEFWGPIDPNKKLGDAVPARIAKLGTLQPTLGSASEAWAVWQTVVGSLGLISFIRGDRCVVTTATDFYTSSDPPRFLWGLNILEFTESRQLGQLCNKAVCVRSYDPLAGKILESLFPSPSVAQKKKRLGATPTKKPRHALHTQDYECFDLPFPVADQATLDGIAERIWQERTRQELSGRMTTREMTVATANGSQNAFDLLTLQAGDQIQVEIERGALDAIQGLTTVGARAAALRAKGYTADTARFIAANIDSIDKLPSQFLVKQAATTLEATGSEGGCKFEMEIEYLNRIDISEVAASPIGAGAATNQADGVNRTPMSGQSTAPKKGKAKT